MFKKEKIILAYTVSRCGSCGRESRRRFAPGDHLFAESGRCQCGGAAAVAMIYGEKQER